jgi:hypothetical protein
MAAWADAACRAVRQTHGASPAALLALAEALAAAPSATAPLFADAAAVELGEEAQGLPRSAGWQLLRLLVVEWDGRSPHRATRSGSSTANAALK